MTHDMTMWCAWRLVGSSVRRSFAPIVDHEAARGRFARMLKPVCHAARAKFCIGCFKDIARCTGFMSGSNSISRGPFLLGNRGGNSGHSTTIADRQIRSIVASQGSCNLSVNP